MCTIFILVVSFIHTTVEFKHSEKEQPVAPEILLKSTNVILSCGFTAKYSFNIHFKNNTHGTSITSTDPHGGIAIC